MNLSAKLTKVMLLPGLILLSILLAVPIVAWSGPSHQVDPFGNPLPAAEQARQQLERLLGQPVPAQPPVRGNTDLRPAAPFEGPDVPVAHTLSEAGVTVQALPADLAETPDVRFTPEVLEVVQRFAGDPQQLYLYVKNNFKFTPYVGS